MKYRLVVLLVVMYSVVAHAVAVATPYRMIQLGSLGGLGTVARGINSRGQIVGTSYTPLGEQHAFLWENGVMTDLGAPGVSSYAYDISDDGVIVGGYQVTGDFERAFVWQDGEMRDLELTSEAGDWSARAVNSEGQIVVNATLLNEWQSFVWDNGTFIDLGNLGLSLTCAYDINDSGQIVGYSSVADSGGGQHAFIWENGSMTDLGTLGLNYSCAYAINAGGDVIGVSDPAPGVRHAFLWIDGVLSDIGAFSAFGINSRRQVVGDYLDSDGNIRACLWEDGAMTDLGTLGDQWSMAWKINDNGWIIGWATTPSGTDEAVVWQPVPEPSSRAGLITGAALVGLVVRRMRAAECRSS